MSSCVLVLRKRNGKELTAFVLQVQIDQEHRSLGYLDLPATPTDRVWALPDGARTINCSMKVWRRLKKTMGMSQRRVTSYGIASSTAIAPDSRRGQRRDVHGGDAPLYENLAAGQDIAEALTRSKAAVIEQFGSDALATVAAFQIIGIGDHRIAIQRAPPEDGKLRRGSVSLTRTRS